MALSGLDIYKLLPKTNCRDCGFATCLAFAMQLAKKAVSIDKCPYLSAEVKQKLEASSLPPIRLVTVGEAENKLEIGNETVMFRHEEKFHHPCGIGFLLDDNLSTDEFQKKIRDVEALFFERVGQKLEVNLIALRQVSDTAKFISALKFILDNTKLNIMLMPQNAATLKEALSISLPRRPLVYGVNKENLSSWLPELKEAKVPVVLCADSLEACAELSALALAAGVENLILDTGKKPIKDKLWDLTQIRRLALKKSNRGLGFPSLVMATNDDPYEEAIAAATFIAKYAGVIILKNTAAWEALSLLTLRQNIYTDPQKPLQIEPKLYSVGGVNKNSPLLVTTNFSLSYFTVLGEVEASKVPAYILSVDTEGQSVLTAWASEKFTSEQVNAAMEKSGAKDAVSHKSIIIPGYVAVMSGDLEEESGWKVVVGPKEAAGIPAFLKKL